MRSSAPPPQRLRAAGPAVLELDGPPGDDRLAAERDVLELALSGHAASVTAIAPAGRWPEAGASPSPGSAAHPELVARVLPEGSAG